MSFRHYKLNLHSSVSQPVTLTPYRLGCPQHTAYVGEKDVHDFYRVHIRALISLYQINSDKCTYILLNHHCSNTVRHSNILQAVHLIYSNGKVTHSIGLAVRMYQEHSLKRVAVTYSVKVLT